MKEVLKRTILWAVAVFFLVAVHLVPYKGVAAERLVTIQSAQVISQSLPWVAQAAGLFAKYNLDHQLVYIASSGIVAAAMVGGNGDIALTGLGIVRAYVQGATDLVFIGGIKNILTHSLLGGAEIRKIEDLKGKKSASAGSGAIPIISPFRCSNDLVWTQPGMWLLSRPAENLRPWRLS